jgi:hypothetical protein
LGRITTLLRARYFRGQEIRTLGRKLIGRWINPIAKTGNSAIKTGAGQTNKPAYELKAVYNAFINDIQVASLTGEPPQGVTFIRLYESSETTQGVWEFTDVTVKCAIATKTWHRAQEIKHSALVVDNLQDQDGRRILP